MSCLAVPEWIRKSSISFDSVVESFLSHSGSCFKSFQLWTVKRIMYSHLWISSLPSISSVGNCFLSIRYSIAQICYKILPVIVLCNRVLSDPNQAGFKNMESKFIRQARAIVLVQEIGRVFWKGWMLYLMERAMHIIHWDQKVRVPFMILWPFNLHTVGEKKQKQERNKHVPALFRNKRDKTQQQELRHTFAAFRARIRSIKYQHHFHTVFFVFPKTTLRSPSVG